MSFHKVLLFFVMIINFQKNVEHTSGSCNIFMYNSSCHNYCYVLLVIHFIIWQGSLKFNFENSDWFSFWPRFCHMDHFYENFHTVNHLFFLTTDYTPSLFLLYVMRNIGPLSFLYRPRRARFILS